MKTKSRLPRARFAAALAVAITCMGGAAWAQAGADTVMLRNGGRIRGTVMEQDPARGVLMRLADGSTRHLAPAEVADVQYGASAAAPAPPPPPASAYGRPTNAADPPLHIDLEGNTVLLQRRISAFEGGASNGVRVAGSEWEDICTSPCDMPAPRNAMLRLGGNGVTMSGLFSVDGATRSIRVLAGSNSTYFAGVWTAALGITGMIAGGAITLGGALAGGGGLLVAGLVVAGAGLVATIIGFPVASGAETHIEADGGRRLVRRTAPSVRLIPGGVAF